MTGNASTVDRNSINKDWDRIRTDLHHLINHTTPADLAKPTDGTAWTNRQMLWHMVFGFVIVRRLLPLVRAFGRLPEPASRVFARGLNAATGPFHRVNYLGGVLGALVFNGTSLIWLFDHTLNTLIRRLDAETEASLQRSMHFPGRWDPFFADTMTIADLYGYAALHYDFHRAQLTLSWLEGGSDAEG